MQPVNVVCLKWGTLYGPEYVNNLYAMVRRNLTKPFRFVCFTDDPRGLFPQIETRPIGNDLKGWWGKIHYFKKPLSDLTGPVLAIDLDMVIVDNIDCFFDFMPGQFLMKWDLAGHGHSSCVMRFEANQYTHIFDRLDLNAIEHSVDNAQPDFKKKKYWGDQIWITEQMHMDPKGRHVQLFPKEWIPKVGLDCWYIPSMGNKTFAEVPPKMRPPITQCKWKVPTDAKILAFAGKNGRNENFMHLIGQWWHANDVK